MLLTKTFNIKEGKEDKLFIIIPLTKMIFYGVFLQLCHFCFCLGCS